MQRKRRTLELLTAATLAASLLGAHAIEASPTWLFVASFAAVIIIGENTPVIVHNGTGVSPSFMTIMAAIALLSADGDGVVLGAGLVGVCGGLYIPHLRARRFGVVLTNCGQFARSAMAAALAYRLLESVNQPVAALGSAMGYAAINISLVVVGVVLYYGERVRAVWADMRPALPNYLAFGLLGLLIGLICAELGPLAVALLAVPMLIGRANYSSFVRLREAHDATIRTPPATPSGWPGTRSTSPRSSACRPTGSSTCASPP
jgi:hypothetical protein